MKSNLSLFILAAASLAAAQSPLVTAKKLAKDYQTALIKKDFASFEKSSTPDFVYIDANGRKGKRAEAMAGMKAFYTGVTIKSFEAKAVSARKANGGIVYIQESKLVGSMSMGGPKPSLVESTSRDEVLAVKQNGRWLTKRVKNLKIEMKADGKKMPGM